MTFSRCLLFFPNSQPRFFVGWSSLHPYSPFGAYNAHTPPFVLISPFCLYTAGQVRAYSCAAMSLLLTPRPQHESPLARYVFRIFSFPRNFWMCSSFYLWHVQSFSPFSPCLRSLLRFKEDSLQTASAGLTLRAVICISSFSPVPLQFRSHNRFPLWSLFCSCDKETSRTALMLSRFSYVPFCCSGGTFFSVRVL